MTRTATVIGSGPNGLAAALHLARAGIAVTVLEAHDRIGGGTRSHRPFTDADLIVDHCSGFHPMAVGSPALAGLEEYGLHWAWPDIDCAHPLIDDAAGLLHRSVTRTAEGLGPDGTRWKTLFRYGSQRYPALADDLLGPVIHIPRHPLQLARFGAPTAIPAASLGKIFRTPQARALFTGVAAHAMRPLTEPFSSAIGLGILTAGHHNGWPVAQGGSAAISIAMSNAIRDLSGTIQTNTPVTSPSDLPRADITIFDTAPSTIDTLYGEALPRATRRAYRRFRHGPAAFKIDLAVHNAVPWSDPRVGQAGTVHIGGTADEIIAAEKDVSEGRLPDKPFVLIGQQFVADPQRRTSQTVPLYAYAHVPRGLTADITDLIIDRIEEFAPGLRSRITEVIATPPNHFHDENANFVGGDILCGASSPRQLLLGPRPGRNPYRTGLSHTYLCSAATPPGPGAHGMAGLHAAQTALKDLRAQ